MNSFISELQNQFNLHQNGERALQMEAYMKNHFLFLGISAPIRRSISNAWISEVNKTCKTQEKWDIVFQLWEMDAREYQCVAIDLLNKFKKQEWLFEDLEKLEQLLISKSWWDSVDALGSNALGEYMNQFPEHQSVIVERWIESNNLWLQRCCLIFQLKYKNNSDFELLKYSILKLNHIKEFFIQKAIGWSLRQYSKFDTVAVKAFISSTELSNLAKREASKYIN